MKIVIIAVVGLLMLGVGIFVGIKFLAPTDSVPAKMEGTKEIRKIDEGAAPVVYPLDTFVVNLTGGGGRRYLKVRMTFEIAAGEKENLDKNLYKIRDSLLILLSSKTLEDVLEAEGKYSLREEMKARLDRIAGKGAVKEIYLEEFVVQ